MEGCLSEQVGRSLRQRQTETHLQGSGLDHPDVGPRLQRPGRSRAFGRIPRLIYFDLSWYLQSRLTVFNKLISTPKRPRNPSVYNTPRAIVLNAINDYIVIVLAVDDNNPCRYRSVCGGPRVRGSERHLRQDAGSRPKDRYALVRYLVIYISCSGLV
jgi:hypothetical protein